MVENHLRFQPWAFFQYHSSMWLVFFFFYLLRYQNGCQDMLHQGLLPFIFYKWKFHLFILTMSMWTLSTLHITLIQQCPPALGSTSLLQTTWWHFSLSPVYLYVLLLEDSNFTRFISMSVGLPCGKQCSWNLKTRWAMTREHRHGCTCVNRRKGWASAPLRVILKGLKSHLI